MPNATATTKYNWKTSTIEPSTKKGSEAPPRPNSITKNVIGGGNFSTLDPAVELSNYNNKQRAFNQTIQQYNAPLHKDGSRRGKTPVESPDINGAKKSISQSLNMSAIIGSSAGGAKIPQYNMN
jgi:hypothetical protein